MSTEQVLKAEIRDQHGTSYSRKLRREQNTIPGIVYGGDSEPVAITMNHDEIFHATEKETFFSTVLDLKIGDKMEKVVLKDIQRHAYKPKIQHLDFYRVSPNRIIVMTVPIHFLNAEEAIGVKEDSGEVVKHINDVEIRCKAKDLPEKLELDIINLKLDEVIHLSGLEVPEGVEIVALTQEEPNDQPVVAVHMPREEEEEEEIEEEEIEGEEGAEGETPEGEAAEGEAKEGEAGEGDKPKGENKPADESDKKE